MAQIDKLRKHGLFTIYTTQRVQRLEKAPILLTFFVLKSGSDSQNSKQNQLSARFNFSIFSRWKPAANSDKYLKAENGTFKSFSLQNDDANWKQTKVTNGDIDEYFAEIALERNMAVRHDNLLYCFSVTPQTPCNTFFRAVCRIIRAHWYGLS